MVAINGTSTGYLGTVETPSIDGVQWAEAQPGFGERYWVESASAAKVAVVSGTTVRVAAGRISGWGVVDTFTGTVDLPLPTPAAEGTTYYLVVARRTWQTTNATTIDYITGTSSRVVPPARNTDPGRSIDDQPLALVAVNKAGSTLTASIADDLRVVGTKGNYEATSELVLTTAGYMDKPGYRIRIAGTEWLRTMAGTWEKIATPIEQSTSFGSSEAGWSASGTAEQSYMFREGRRRVMYLQQKRVGGTISPSPNTGHIANVALFRLSDGDRPAAEVVVPVLYRGASSDYSGTALARPDGYVFLCALSPNADLLGGKGAVGEWSTKLSAEWYTA